MGGAHRADDAGQAGGVMDVYLGFVVLMMLGMFVLGVAAGMAVRATWAGRARSAEPGSEAARREKCQFN